MTVGRASREWGAIRLELIIAGTALLISLCALIVSAVETRLLASQQRASVWPYLDVSAGYGPEGFRLTVSNNGIGPARVTALSVSVDGTPRRDWPAVITAMVGPDAALDHSIYRTDVINDTVIPAEADRLFWLVPWTDESRRIADDLDRVNITVCFCSVFDECWVSDLKKAGRETSCPIGKDAQFDG